MEGVRQVDLGGKASWLGYGCCIFDGWKLEPRGQQVLVELPHVDDNSPPPGGFRDREDGVCHVDYALLDIAFLESVLQPGVDDPRLVRRQRPCSHEPDFLGGSSWTTK